MDSSLWHLDRFASHPGMETDLPCGSSHWQESTDKEKETKEEDSGDTCDSSHWQDTTGMESEDTRACTSCCPRDDCPAEGSTVHARHVASASPSMKPCSSKPVQQLGQLSKAQQARRAAPGQHRPCQAFNLKTWHEGRLDDRLEERPEARLEDRLEGRLDDRPEDYKLEAADHSSEDTAPETAVPAGDTSSSSSSSSSSPLQDLPEHLVGSILEAVSKRTCGLEHLLVCRQWKEESVWSQVRVEVREGMLVSEEELLEALESFPHLRSLRLNRGSLIHLDPSFLTSLTQRCPRLTHLHLENLTGQQSLEPPPDTCRLRHLFLHGRVVPDWVSRVTALSHLTLKGPRELPRSFGQHLQALRKLKLEATQVDSFPTTVSLMSSLTSLELNLYSQSRLPPGLEHFGEGLRKLRATCPCVSTAEGLSGICNLRSLKKLKIKAGRGLASLPQAIGRLQDLESLTITQPQEDSRGGLEDDTSAAGHLKLPPNFWCLRGLRELQLQGLCAEETLPGLASMAGLEVLVLRRCGVKQLPGSISTLKKLKRLCVFDCPQLRGSLLNASPLH